jgi:hypothetical protein
MNDPSSALQPTAAPRRGVKIYERPGALALALRQPQVWLGVLGVAVGGVLTYFYVVAT